MDSNVCERKGEEAKKSRRGASMESNRSNTLASCIERIELVLRGLEAIQSGHLSEFVAAERDEQSPGRFLSSMAWSTRDVGKVFELEVERLQIVCNHAAHTPNWESFDVRKCTRCEYHK